MAAVDSVLALVESVNAHPQVLLKHKTGAHVWKNLPDTEQQALKAVKLLYDTAKKNESKAFGVLEELLIDGFDREQIWEEIQLRHQPLLSFLSSYVTEAEKEQPTQPNPPEKSAHLAASKQKHNDVVEDDLNMEQLEDDVDDLDENIENDEDMDADLDEEEEEDLENTSSKKKRKPSSVVDDQFFSLADMNEFVEETEQSELNKDDELKKGKEDNEDDDDDEEDEDEDEEIDLFQDPGSEDEDENATFHDFFDPVDQEDDDGNQMDQSADIDDQEEYDDDDEEPSTAKRGFLEDESDEETAGLSKYEKKLNAIRKTINKLEDENLQKRAWQHMGEASAKDRPVNSLLDEVLEFDHASKSAPLITEEVTDSLEEMIKRRILDGMFDDVQRKHIEPAKDERTNKAEFVLEQDKSKKSLSEIYETAYLKQQQQQQQKAASSTENAPSAVVVESETDKLHKRIREQIKQLFTTLDALTHFKYTPNAPQQEELQVVANVPAMVVEEQLPTATSEASRLAPEEIYKRSTVIAGDTELSGSEKKRLRSKAKVVAKKKNKDRKERDMLKLEKGKPGLGNKYAKEKLKDILKDSKNVQVIGENGLKPAAPPKKTAAFKL